MTIYDILKDTSYKTEQFSNDAIDRLNERLVEKEDKNGKKYAVVNCLVRKKDIRLNPEEVVRQLFVDKLINDYGYPVSRMKLEYQVYFGREVKRADIVIMDDDRPIVPYIIIEVKKPKLKDGKEQLKSYCNSTGAPIAVWTNGEQIAYYNRKDPNYFEDIRDIPKASQTLMDIVSERWTMEDLKVNDILQKDRVSLKDKIKELEDEVLANAGVDVFEECFKLIFTKLYDEWLSGQTPSRYLEFTNAGRTEFKLKEAIQDLFDKANKKWKGVFEPNSKIALSPSHLSVCVASLQNVKLFNSNLEVVDDAFEYLMSKSSKGEKTPQKKDGTLDPEAGLIDTISLITDLETQRQKLAPYNRMLLESGEYWRRAEGRFNVNTRIDTTLMNNLRVMRRRLITRIKSRVNNVQISTENIVSIVHGLLSRSILIKYLEERKDSNGESVFPKDFYEQFSFDNTVCKQYTDVLGNKDATYNLFSVLESKFNGDMLPLIDNEREIITKGDLQELKSFLIGDSDLESQQMTLWPLPFLYTAKAE